MSKSQGICTSEASTIMAIVNAIFPKSYSLNISSQNQIRLRLQNNVKFV